MNSGHTRFLLISDTHGDLDLINGAVEKVRADAVIHAGDFGFYDQGSYLRLPKRELELTVRHSSLPTDEKSRLLRLPANAMIEELRERSLLSQLPDYLAGIKSFDVPIFAVWGNHEDDHVIREFLHGGAAVPNLNLLVPGTIHEFGTVQLIGLGGNFLPGAKLLEPSPAGSGGKVWCTLDEMESLMSAADARPAAGARVLVTHVSPGKERYVEQLAYRVAANMTVSGHMGAPTTMAWNAFGISTLDESRARLNAAHDSVLAACRTAAVDSASSTDARRLARSAGSGRG